jgi:hypothetical protein
LRVEACLIAAIKTHEVDMGKKSINAALDVAFGIRHWQRMRLCAMPPAFARDLDVTPIFLARPVRKSAAVYSIDGYIGLICQPFERNYIAEHGTQKVSGRAWNPIWLCLHVANVADILEVAYITSEKDMSVLCDRITSHLERMPHTMPDLRAILHKQELLGRPLESWAFSKPEKLDALRNYMKHFAE